MCVLAGAGAMQGRVSLRFVCEQTVEVTEERDV